MNIKTKDIVEENKELVSFLKKQSPSDYIDYCTKSKLKSGDKARLTKIWVKVTKNTVKDLEYARNRHPYWKKLKEKGSVERNKVRLEKYYFYDDKKYVRSRKWTDEEIKEFLNMNETTRDWELAKHFKRSIPAVQYIRRKIQLAVKLAEKNKVKPSDKRYLFKMLQIDEKQLRNQLLDNVKVKAKKK